MAPAQPERWLRLPERRRAGEPEPRRSGKGRHSFARSAPRATRSHVGDNSLSSHETSRSSRQRPHQTTRHPSICQLSCREAQNRPARALPAEVSAIDPMVANGTTSSRRATAHRTEHQELQRRARRLASAPCTAQEINEALGRWKTAPSDACAAGREQVRAEPPGERRRAHVPVGRHEQPARLQPSRAELPEPPHPRRARHLFTMHAVRIARRRPPRLAVDLQPRRVDARAVGCPVLWSRILRSKSMATCDLYRVRARACCVD